MEFLQEYQDLFQKAIEENKIKGTPAELYEPINYILSVGGKRIRPIITMISCDFFGGDVNQATKPGIAIEYFHNFTLMHDDIMDSATLRRGKECVHRKYGINSAILSGDALMVIAYQMFEDLPAEKYKQIVSLFSQTAVTLCEGQQFDLNFENQHNVDFDEYIQMIYSKTGALTAAAFKIGAIIADASEEDARHIYNFGKNLGIAFQLKDDLLDVYGRNVDFGKKHAGDIHENKKTILYIKALEKASKEQEQELRFWYDMRTENIDKIYGVERIFKNLKISKDVSLLIKEYTQKAFDCLEKIEGNKDKKDILIEFGNRLINREV